MARPTLKESLLTKMMQSRTATVIPLHSAPELPEERAIERAIEQTTGQTVEQSGKQWSKQPDGQTGKQSSGQSMEQSSGQSIGQSSRLSWLPLNENQGRLLMYLFEQSTRLTNMEIICAETKIPYGTARKAIDVLMEDGYMISKTRHNGHAFKGFNYVMNDPLCALYISRLSEQSSGQSSGQWSKQTNGQTMEQTIAPLVVSLLKDSKDLTTKTLHQSCHKPGESENYSGILDTPELRWWKGREKGEGGITERKVETWLAEFEMSRDEMSLSLRHGKFDILRLGNIASPENWFYKRLVANGAYICPDYRSPAEIRAEALQAQQKRDEAAQEVISKAEQEEAFQRIISSHESPEYQALYAQTSEWARQLGGTDLSNDMRNVFLEQHGIPVIPATSAEALGGQKPK